MKRVSAYQPQSSDVVELTAEQWERFRALKAQAAIQWAIYRRSGLILSYRVDAMRKAKDLDEQARNVGRPRP